ncbi:hypothetical protein ACFL0G_04355 [Candidatus Zixiibacteriota bacterium]
MTVKRDRIGWGFWLQWVLLSSVGCSIGLFVGFVFGSIISENAIGDSALGHILGYFMLGAGLGFMVGLMQWFVLRRYIPRASLWVLLSTVGFALAMGSGYGAAVVSFGYSEGLDELGSFAAILGWTVVVALGGAVMGILQWLVLRREISRAGWWMLASTVGWGLSMAVAGAILIEYKWAYSPGGALVLLFGSGALLGAITGGALVWILRQPLPES